MSSRRLDTKQLASLPATIRRPAYDRTVQRTGIVHLGIGAFHRAHQAVYTDDAMAAGDSHWAITGVSLRSAEVRNALQAQDGLYSLVERERDREQLRIIGAVRKVLIAPEDPEAVIASLASPDTHIVSFTITEKGYLGDASSGSLLMSDKDLLDDLKGEGAPRTIYGFLEHAFRRRRAARLPGMTLLSCDNLAENGRQLSMLLDEYLQLRDPTLAAWVRNETTCPSTMVDRIVPATTAADLEHVAKRLGCTDQGAVVTEPFKQWVIEDRFIGGRPRWEAGGARFTQDVKSYETAKLRMLNGAHSALAYVGTQLGLEYVHEAIANSDLKTLVRQLMSEATASLKPVAGQDLALYAEELLYRFENPSLQHRLKQIAMDGTQKIPQRWLLTLAVLQQQGQSSSALLFALAAWMAFVCTPGRLIDDPLSSQLVAIRELTSGDADATVDRLAGNDGLLNRSWQPDPVAGKTIAGYLRDIVCGDMHQALRKWVTANLLK